MSRFSELKQVFAKALPGKTLFCWACILTSMLLVWLVVGNMTMAQAELSGVPDLPKELRKGKSFVLVEFFTQWCGVCQEMSPYVENIKVEGCSDLKVLQLDTDKPANAKYAQMYGVYGVPTFILFNPTGRAVYKMDDLISSRVLRKNILKSMSRPEKGPISVACKY